MNSRMTKTLTRGKELLSGFTPGQRGVIIVVTLALVLGAFALTRWVSSPTWTPLYGNLEGSDAQRGRVTWPEFLAAQGSTPREAATSR